MTTRRALVTTVLFLGSPAASQIQPGDLFTTEFQVGSIVNIRGGGDFTAAPRFATGLTFPASICFGPGASVYATPSTEVVVIDDGGDLSGATPFASGFNPGEGYLACSDSQIFYGSNGTGEIFDITAGGDFSMATPHATGLGSLGPLLLDSGGTLWAAVFGVGIFDVTAGGDFSMAAPFASGASNGVMGEWGGSLLVPGTFQVLDFTAGGDLSVAPVFASVTDPRALLGVQGRGLFSATGSGSGVWEISAGGDLLGTPAFATGVQSTFGLASLAFVHGCGDGILDTGEECDDGNTMNGDSCDATCAIGAPEPAQALLLVAGGLVLALFARRRAG